MLLSYAFSREQKLVALSSSNFVIFFFGDIGCGDFRFLFFLSEVRVYVE